jgi:PTH1 family peptidyl-tRNA hydrolase
VSLERLAVIHDDLDLPFGRLRVRRDGSAAGHHGVESIIGALASRDFVRFRVGIDRPVGEGTDYVLGVFTEAERQQLLGLVQRVGDAVLFALEHGVDRAMTEFNKR